MALLGVLAMPAGAFADTATRRFEASGVRVWLTPLDRSDAQLSVRLELQSGLADEPPNAWGRTALLAAWMRRAATPHLDAGGLERHAHRAGLEVSTAARWRSVGLQLDGPPAALETALWLATERLLQPPSPEGLAKTLRGVLWRGAEPTRYSAVSPHGDAIDTIVGRLLGSKTGHTAFSSRLRASQLDRETLVQQTLTEASRAPARLVVACPKDRLERAAALIRRELDTVSRRTPPQPPELTRSRKARSELPATLSLQTSRGERVRVLAAWDLRGAAREVGLDLMGRDALLLTLESWVGHEGATPARRLVEDHAVARSLRARLRDRGHPVLVAEAEARGDGTSELERRLVEEVERLRTGDPPAEELRGAAREAASRLAMRWGHASGRVELLATLVATGRVPVDGRLPGAWLSELRRRLRDPDLEALRGFAEWALRPDRRTVATVTPERDGGSRNVQLDDALLDTYLRIMVDLRCPPPGRNVELSRLLDEKYDMSPRTHVMITRALSERPDMMRELTHAAENRCRAYDKLRSMMPAERAIALHEAVACEAGDIADEAERHARLERIYERFDVDPSWYRPLVRMYRRDRRYGPKIRAIDQRCTPEHGPAAR